MLRAFLSPRPVAGRLPLHPSLKLILPNTPHAAYFECGNLALSRETCDSERVKFQDFGDFAWCESLDRFHLQGHLR